MPQKESFEKRFERASRGFARRAPARRPVARKIVPKAASAQVRKVVRSKPKRTESASVTRRAERRAATRQVQVVARKAADRTTRKAAGKAPRKVLRPRPGMAAVIAFARAQLGKRYGRGGSGPRYFDCSGFTKSAYARAGIVLPHSSGGQAARARKISRAQARPGDLVVGRGHVGVYMGGNMMIDAGNRRTGVVFRKLYAGLHIERL